MWLFNHLRNKKDESIATSENLKPIIFGQGEGDKMVEALLPCVGRKVIHCWLKLAGGKTLSCLTCSYGRDISKCSVDVALLDDGGGFCKEATAYSNDGKDAIITVEASNKKKLASKLSKAVEYLEGAPADCVVSAYETLYKASMYETPSF